MNSRRGDFLQKILKLKVISAMKLTSLERSVKNQGCREQPQNILDPFLRTLPKTHPETFPGTPQEPKVRGVLKGHHEPLRLFPGTMLLALMPPFQPLLPAIWTATTLPYL